MLDEEALTAEEWLPTGAQFGFGELFIRLCDRGYRCQCSGWTIVAEDLVEAPLMLIKRRLCCRSPG